MLLSSALLAIAVDGAPSVWTVLILIAGAAIAFWRGWFGDERAGSAYAVGVGVGFFSAMFW